MAHHCLPVRQVFPSRAIGQWETGKNLQPLGWGQAQCTLYTPPVGILFLGVLSALVSVDHQRRDRLHNRNRCCDNGVSPCYLSRTPDPEDYCLRAALFRQACARFGVRPQLDLFANRYNRQLPRFYAMRPDPLAEGINALAQTWPTTKVLYANPPWSLIGEFLQKVSAEAATVLTVLPVWQAQPWWATFCQMWVAPPMYLQGEMSSCPQGRPLPPPRWKVAITLIRGPPRLI